ncbi:MAG: hypothetical protein IJN17_01355 [Clostridia bacterium]|nr:hypothetical protein [Oscillospiraceae bacterium]MBQ4095650.1 hypothetical protein [Oscillospiraceae bacterium]MBQ6701586.1 hypothetical protein [Clostridia bacterium]
MTDNKPSCLNSFANKENVCIDVSRILDSCRDKDCFEDVKVFLNAYGREVIDNATSVRAKCSKILAANINIEPLQFNRGFYQIYIRYYVKIVCEACIGLGRSREFDGLAVCEKNVILYGSEGNVNIFKSEMGLANTISCGCNTTMSTNLPTVAVEVVDPIILNAKIAEDSKCCCCCCCTPEEVPENISEFFGGGFENDENTKNLYVSLGFFSVVRIERPGQYIISASEFSVPDKECIMTQPDDPCSAFAKMAFPVNEFNPPSIGCTKRC